MTNALAIDIALDRGTFALTIAESVRLSGTTAVFGPSGSGKTSLLRVVAGLEPAARGTVRFRSDDWQSAAQSLPPESRAVGLVFQDGRLFSHLDVRGNLTYASRHGGRSGPISFDDVVEALGLLPLLDRQPANLSGGERQRVAIGRALLANPTLLLMDEPLSSLDVKRKRELLPLIKQLPVRYDIPVVYVTHNLDELVYLADDVLLLKAGRCIAHGTAREVLAHAEFAQLAELTDPGVLLEAKLVEHGNALSIVSVGRQKIRAPKLDTELGAAVRLRVHARDVIVATEKPTKLSIRNCLETRVLQLDARAGGQVDVVVDIDGQTLVARITRDAADELGLEIGQTVFALIKTVALDGLGG